MSEASTTALREKKPADIDVIFFEDHQPHRQPPPSKKDRKGNTTLAKLIERQWDEYHGNDNHAGYRRSDVLTNLLTVIHDSGGTFFSAVTPGSSSTASTSNVPTTKSKKVTYQVLDDGEALKRIALLFQTYHPTHEADVIIDAGAAATATTQNIEDNYCEQQTKNKKKQHQQQQAHNGNIQFRDQILLAQSQSWTVQQLHQSLLDRGGNLCQKTEFPNLVRSLSQKDSLELIEHALSHGCCGKTTPAENDVFRGPNNDSMTRLHRGNERFRDEIERRLDRCSSTACRRVIDENDDDDDDDEHDNEEEDEAATVMRRTAANEILRAIHDTSGRFVQPSPLGGGLYEIRNDDDVITELTNHLLRSCRNVKDVDVLTGRGHGSNDRPGNDYFRLQVETRFERYVVAENKQPIVCEVKDAIEGPPRCGRFLKACEGYPGLFVELSDREARTKISQRFREGKRPPRGGGGGGGYVEPSPAVAGDGGTTRKTKRRKKKDSLKKMKNDGGTPPPPVLPAATDEGNDHGGKISPTNNTTPAKKRKHPQDYIEEDEEEEDHGGGATANHVQSSKKRTRRQAEEEEAQEETDPYLRVEQNNPQAPPSSRTTPLSSLSLFAAAAASGKNQRSSSSSSPPPLPQPSVSSGVVDTAWMMDPYLIPLKGAGGSDSDGVGGGGGPQLSLSDFELIKVGRLRTASAEVLAGTAKYWNQRGDREQSASAPDDGTSAAADAVAPPADGVVAEKLALLRALSSEGKKNGGGCPPPPPPPPHPSCDGGCDDKDGRKCGDGGDDAIIPPPPRMVKKEETTAGIGGRGVNGGGIIQDATTTTTNLLQMMPGPAGGDSARSESTSFHKLLGMLRGFSGGFTAPSPPPPPPPAPSSQEERSKPGRNDDEDDYHPTAREEVVTGKKESTDDKRRLDRGEEDDERGGCNGNNNRFRSLGTVSMGSLLGDIVGGGDDELSSSSSQQRLRDLSLLSAVTLPPDIAPGDPPMLVVRIQNDGATSSSAPPVVVASGNPDYVTPKTRDEPKQQQRPPPYAELSVPDQLSLDDTLSTVLQKMWVHSASTNGGRIDQNLPGPPSEGYDWAVKVVNTEDGGDIGTFDQVEMRRETLNDLIRRRKKGEGGGGVPNSNTGSNNGGVTFHVSYTKRREADESPPPANNGEEGGGPKTSGDEEVRELKRQVATLFMLLVGKGAAAPTEGTSGKATDEELSRS